MLFNGVNIQNTIKGVQIQVNGPSMNTCMYIILYIEMYIRHISSDGDGQMKLTTVWY